MEEILSAIIGYLVGFAADGVLSEHEKRMQDELEKKLKYSKAIASTRPLSDELRTACTHLAKYRDRLGISKQEEPLWKLLSDEAFQDDLVEWLKAGGIEEGNTVKARILQKMEAALITGGASQERTASLKNGYFDSIDKAVFSHSALAHWRHQLSLDYLREQVRIIKDIAEKAAGVYSLEAQSTAIDQYCQMALTTWDIIDLSNLPADDIDIGTQQLLLRQLYMPLRIEVEPIKQEDDDNATFNRLEEQREERRRREAGRRIYDAPARLNLAETRSPIGKCLDVSPRLVVLGDPGGGKTTMLRWLATAYLLRHKGDDAFKQIPDTETLPSRPWIPVLIRCRDLGEADLCRSFSDFLTQHLRKTELQPNEANVMTTVVLDRIAKGEVLLLVDGLDEITSPQIRMMFCQELERTSVRYPDSPIVVTSRIVGYRDMPYRMGSGFEHGVIAELNREDKDLFAKRWIAVTEQYQSEPEKNKRSQELLEALHSSDRIERLTSNPMLLTTLALVKRKVGKLPNRRNKLYAEAVSVLLNWNPRLYKTIEEDEAIPQLEYLAYEMCKRGVQRLTGDEVLDLLDKLRVEYPNIRAIRKREPQKFLALLEERSSILIKSGGVWQENKTHEKPVWEFRHLTFQEYLAARALLDGRYPDRDRGRSLSAQVAPLAGSIEKAKQIPPHVEGEMEVPESWREALRLLVADCKDDDVDEVLMSILHPQQGEEETTSKPRAVLATLCLADEPNVSEETALQVLAAFVTKVNNSDGNGYTSSLLDRAAIEVGGSIWLPSLKKLLLQEYCQREPDKRLHVGGLLAMLETSGWARTGLDSQVAFTGLLNRLCSVDQNERILAALTVMEAAFDQNALVIPGLIYALMQTLNGEPTERLAGVWALLWLNGGFTRGLHGLDRNIYWEPTGTELSQLLKHLKEAPDTEIDFKRFLSRLISNIDADNGEVTATMLIPYLASDNAEFSSTIINLLGKFGDTQAVPPLLARLVQEPDAKVRLSIIQTLGKLGDIQAVAPLIELFENESDKETYVATIQSLGLLGDTQIVPLMLSRMNLETDEDIRTAMIGALGCLMDKRATEPLFFLLDSDNAKIFDAAANALTALAPEQLASTIINFLSHESPEKRMVAVRTLLTLRNNPNEKKLLSRDFDNRLPWIDPATPITEKRIEDAAQVLEISIPEAHALYEAIADDYHLKFTS